MAERKICSIERCGNDVLARGWCRKHYQRWLRKGDPLAQNKYSERGEPLNYLMDHMTDGCCYPWLYAKHVYGYPQVQFNGKQMLAHRVVCEEVNGPSPFDGAEVRHLCGKGHLGCFNADCLRWGSRSENHQDKLVHGTHHRGERNPSSKLTNEQARLIKESLGNMTLDEAADFFDVHRETVRRIINGSRWSWL
jgi:hypothetical protein